MNTQLQKYIKDRNMDIAYNDVVLQYTKEGGDVEIEPYLLSDEEIMQFNFNIMLAKSITRKRKELGWTQADLAQKSGVNRITIARIEKYQHTASVEVIIKLLYALNMKLTVADDE